MHLPTSRASATLTLAALLIIPTALLSAPAHAGPPLAVIARSGDQVPGQPAGFTMSPFGAGTITSNGLLGFSAHLPEMTSGFIVGVPGDLRMAVRTGDPAPGFPSPGMVFHSAFANRLNARGDFVTVQSVVEPGAPGSHYGIWMSTGGGPLQTLAVLGEQAPGVPNGVHFDPLAAHFFERITLSNAGIAAFGARLAGPGIDPTNSTAVFAGTPGDLRLVARAGDPAPSLGEGVHLGGLYLHGLVGPRINASGRMTFFSSLTGPGLDPSTDAAIWTADNSGRSLAARTGQPVAVPGVPDATIANFSVGYATPMINNAGHVAFPAHVAGTGIPSHFNDAVIVVSPTGAAAAVARMGEPAPDMPDGWRFAGAFFQNLRLNGAGEVLFSADLALPGSPGQFSHGAFIGDPGDLRLVARNGGPIPGLPDGSVMGNINFASMVTNARGQVAFHSSASEMTPEGLQDRNGIWAFDPIAGLFPVVVAGDEVELAPGDTRTVSLAHIAWNDVLGNSGGQDGASSNLNDAGQLILNATFTDGTRAVITTTIPSPAGALLLALSAPLLTRRRRIR